MANLGQKDIFYWFLDKQIKMKKKTDHDILSINFQIFNIYYVCIKHVKRNEIKELKI